MSKNVVPSGSTATLGVVKGDLEIGKHAVVKGEGAPPRVTVSGTVYVEGGCIFQCSLSAENLDARGRMHVGWKSREDEVTVEGDLKIRNRVNIEDGCLVVLGNMTAKRVDVDRSLAVKKDFEVDEVNVGGSLKVDGATTAQEIDVGGSFKAEGEVKAESIDVGGSVKIESKVDIEDVDVGGKVEVNGGKINRVDVGGSFVSKDSLEFEKINVGGAVKLAGESRGGDIDVGGSCKIEGDLKFGDIDVGGVFVISGSADGADVDVGGKVKVGGNLKLSEKLDVGGVADIDEELVAQDIDVGGRLRARKATADKRASVGGSIETIEGVSASYVRIGRRGRVKGPIRADEAVISERAQVEDVYAKTITLERDAEARNLYGERIRLESGCQVYGEVQYTESLESERGVSFAKTPQKADKLP
jgi:cytoskeletal protein CcmA (bactofilin family)